MVSAWLNISSEAEFDRSGHMAPDLSYNRAKMQQAALEVSPHQVEVTYFPPLKEVMQVWLKEATKQTSNSHILCLVTPYITREPCK